MSAPVAARAAAGVAAAGGVGALLSSWFMPSQPANITHTPHHHHFHDVQQIPKTALEHPGNAPATVSSGVAGLMESWTGPADPVNHNHSFKHGTHLPPVPGHVETTPENSVFGLASNWVSGELKGETKH
uniref:Uncharacterized protein n=1 Tax=Chlamydomonas leiostraca TaxID=1034604 RepID=A0A7S0RNX7_9CHLO|mmetsp:Transcript_27834/g.70964  ORF Transcript_27834/g.70964 Transcript_27834/m.70964 type:complete len:129 (+) Transcript_27834:120-506(+)|eukprot:CAMPEP_0202857910 /NCGR_PEP_ID=MMETSP1391-20130828/660_1 /ASSEMBLY_ACC=CAM_ASM_000867 /TAXON_ID=1034604 /ORGANISM="Chlamydomonas leiostraca, Strain SAG 11-49" /LENGTH=128 /DNA_ID=CAMNT_0049536773 /DNA_START=113 /DNA_END=499 /DNA_ORIENTATION=+